MLKEDLLLSLYTYIWIHCKDQSQQWHDPNNQKQILIVYSSVP